MTTEAVPPQSRGGHSNRAPPPGAVLFAGLHRTQGIPRPGTGLQHGKEDNRIMAIEITGSVSCSTDQLGAAPNTGRAGGGFTQPASLVEPTSSTRPQRIRSACSAVFGRLESCIRAPAGDGTTHLPESKGNPAAEGRETAESSASRGCAAANGETTCCVLQFGNSDQSQHTCFRDSVNAVHGEKSLQSQSSKSPRGRSGPRG